jgi:hypothetical protein
MGSDGEEGECVSRFQIFAMFLTLYQFFWAIPLRLNFICQRSRTLCSIFIGGVRRKKEQTDRSETSEIKFKSRESPKERIQRDCVCFSLCEQQSC